MQFKTSLFSWVIWCLMVGLIFIGLNIYDSIHSGRDIGGWMFVFAYIMFGLGVMLEVIRRIRKRR